MARTAKKKIEILDEGIVLTDDVDSIDFAGSGVSGTVVSRNVTEAIPGATTTVPAGSGTEVQYRLNSTTFGAFAGSAVDNTNQRLGLQKATPEAPIHVASTVAETLADVTNMSSVLVAEVSITPPSASASIIYVPQTATNPATSEVDYGAGNFTASFQTYNYEIYAYKLSGGIYYAYGVGSTSYTDSSGDSHTFNVQVSCDSMTNADGYFFYNSSNGQYYDSATPSVIDNGTGSSGSPSIVLVSSAFIATGQTIDFYPVGIGTSPSGQLYYSASGSTYSVTDSVNDSVTPFIISHTSASSLPIYVAQVSDDNNEQMSASPFTQTAAFGSETDLSTKHYGFLSNGTTLNKTYRVNTYDSYLGIYSSGAEDSVTDPNDSAYYSVTTTFTGVTKPPASMSYKKFRKQTGGAYGNSIFSTSTTFYDDNLSGEYGQSPDVASNSSLPNSFIAEADSDAVTGPAIAVIRSTNASTPIASLQGQNSIGGNLWSLRNTSATAISLGNDQSTPTISFGNLTSPQATLGSSNVINLQKSSAVHFTVWGLNSTLPSLYSFSSQDTVYFGRSNESSNPNAMVLIQPKAASQRGMIIRGFASQSQQLLEFTNSAGSSLASINASGHIGAGTTAVTTARFVMAAGSTTISPFKWTSGSLKSSPLAGDDEFLGNKRYFTITTGAARKEYMFSDTTLVSGRVSFGTTDGRQTDDSGFTFVTTPGLVINENGTSTMGLRVEGDTDANLLKTDPATDFVGIGASIIDRKLHVEDSTNVTNAVRYVARFSHISSGTVATNFGIGHEFEMENASNTNKIIATQTYAFTDATNNSEDVTWKLSLIKAGAMTDAVTVTSVGDMTVAGTFNASNQYSSRYTPTLTGVTNVTATTARQATFFRVGNSVTVSGQFDVTPTGVGQVVVGISLPVASAFTTAYQLGGAGHSPTVAGHGASIMADATNDRASFSYVDTAGSADTMTYTFTYDVV